MNRRRKTPAALEQFEQLRVAEQRRRQEARAIELERQAANAELHAAREALVEGLTREAEDPAAQQRFEEAQRKAAQPWPERIEASERRVKLATGDVARFVHENLDVIGAEMRANAEEAAANYRAALEAVLLRSGELAAVDGLWTSILSYHGSATAREMRPLGLEHLARDVKRALQNPVPVPMPRMMGGGAIEPDQAEVAA